MFLRTALGLQANGVVCFVGAGGKTSLMFRLAKELEADGVTVLTTTTTKIHIPTEQQSPHVILGTTARDIETKARKHMEQLSHVSVAL